MPARAKRKSNGAALRSAAGGVKSGECDPCCGDIACDNTTNCADSDAGVIETCTGFPRSITEPLHSFTVEADQWQSQLGDFKMQPLWTVDPVALCKRTDGNDFSDAGRSSVFAYYRHEQGDPDIGTQTLDTLSSIGVTLDPQITDVSASFDAELSIYASATIGYKQVTLYCSVTCSEGAFWRNATVTITLDWSPSESALCAGTIVTGTFSAVQRDSYESSGGGSEYVESNSIGSVAGASAQRLTSVDLTQLDCRQCPRHINISGEMWANETITIDDPGDPGETMEIDRDMLRPVRGRMSLVCGTGECTEAFRCRYRLEPGTTIERYYEETDTWETFLQDGPFGTFPVYLEMRGPRLWLFNGGDTEDRLFHIKTSGCCVTTYTDIDWHLSDPDEFDPDPPPRVLRHELVITASACKDTDLQCHCDDPCVPCADGTSFPSEIDVTFMHLGSPVTIVGTKVQNNPVLYDLAWDTGSFYYEGSLEVVGEEYVLTVLDPGEGVTLVNETLPCGSGVLGTYSGGSEVE